MSNHINPVVVDRERYDELLRKETLFDAIVKMHERMSDYVFRDAVGYLLGQEKAAADE